MFNSMQTKLKNHFKKNKYIVYLNLTDEIELLLVYHRAMVNIDLLQKSLIPSLLEKTRISPNLETLDIPGIRKLEETDIDSTIFSGNIVIYNHANKKLYALNAENIPTRQTSDPINDISISGPRDALVESNDKNVALIQKRIKSNELTIEQYTIGDITNTGVVLMYLDITHLVGGVEAENHRHGLALLAQEASQHIEGWHAHATADEQGLIPRFG